jgi:hypothetical protein
MTDLATTLATLRRPALLVRAARFGIAEYDRRRDLARLVHWQGTPAPEQALRELIATEATLEQTRREGAAGYSLARHIEVLIAMLAEARLLAPRPALSVV